MLVEVVQHVADINLVPGHLQLLVSSSSPFHHNHHVPVLPAPKAVPLGRERGLGQEAVVRAAGADGGNGAVGRGVDALHHLRLALPILLVVLHDAQRVDPEVPDPQAARDEDGVAKGPRQLGQLNLPLLSCLFLLSLLALAPALLLLFLLLMSRYDEVGLYRGADHIPGLVGPGRAGGRNRTPAV
jgi:hypothetical protein